jgi:hypothetical protein
LKGNSLFKKILISFYEYAEIMFYYFYDSPELSEKTLYYNDLSVNSINLQTLRLKCFLTIIQCVKNI